MSAPNSKIIRRTFGAKGARQIAEALKGGDYAQMRAKSARHLAHNPRTTLQGLPKASAQDRLFETTITTGRA